MMQQSRDLHRALKTTLCDGKTKLPSIHMIESLVRERKSRVRTEIDGTDGLRGVQYTVVNKKKQAEVFIMKSLPLSTAVMCILQSCPSVCDLCLYFH